MSVPVGKKNLRQQRFAFEPVEPDVWQKVWASFFSTWPTPLGMRASRNCHQVIHKVTGHQQPLERSRKLTIPKKNSKNCQEAFCLFKTSEGVWSLRSKSTCWKLFPGVTRFCSAIFAMVSRWWFQRLWGFFTTNNWRNKSKQMNCAWSFCSTSSVERNQKPPNLVFRSYFARIWVFHVLFLSQWVKRFLWIVHEINACVNFAECFSLDPSSRERNKDL